jgi:hypothetical protein
MSELDKSTGCHTSVSAEGLGRAAIVQAVRGASSDVGEQISAHKLTLPDSVFTRLKLHAIKRGSTASAIAAEVLDRNLPRLRIAADD